VIPTEREADLGESDLRSGGLGAEYSRAVCRTQGRHAAFRTCHNLCAAFVFRGWRSLPHSKPNKPERSNAPLTGDFIGNGGRYSRPGGGGSDALPDRGGDRADFTISTSGSFATYNPVMLLIVEGWRRYSGELLAQRRYKRQYVQHAFESSPTITYR